MNKKYNDASRNLKEKNEEVEVLKKRISELESKSRFDPEIAPNKILPISSQINILSTQSKDEGREFKGQEEVLQTEENTSNIMSKIFV